MVTLKKAGQIAVSITAISIAVTYGASFFVLASDEKVYRTAQSQLDEYQSRDINKMLISGEMSALRAAVDKVVEMDGAAAFQDLTPRETEYRAFLMEDIGTSIETIEELGGSTTRVKLLLKRLNEGTEQ